MWALGLLLAFLLTACTQIFNRPEAGSPALTPQVTANPASPTPAVETTIVTPQPARQMVLRIWVPPEFDPDSGAPAAALFQARLNEFSKNHPELRIEVRVKALEGPGGLLDALAAAGAAAPGALPDLIALSPDLLEAAALKGLLLPYTGLTKTMEDRGWYAYAQELARYQGAIYGLPFAGDALALVHRPPAMPVAPLDWQAVQQLPAALMFPAGDPLALYTLSAYQSAGGQPLDEQGQPDLDTLALTEVLTYYAGARQAGVMPEWLTQMQTFDQSWDALVQQRADLAVAWTSRFLAAQAAGETADLALAPLPTPGGRDQTLATGWVWALAARAPERQQLAVELAEYLTEERYLAAWQAAAGRLPVHSGSLPFWKDQSSIQALGRIARSARLLPPDDAVAALGQVLQAAVVQVLAQRSDPVSAALAAEAGLTAP